jgi:hypothetical protein
VKERDPRPQAAVDLESEAALLDVERIVRAGTAPTGSSRSSPRRRTCGR